MHVCVYACMHVREHVHGYVYVCGMYLSMYECMCMRVYMYVSPMYI